MREKCCPLFKSSLLLKLFILLTTYSLCSPKGVCVASAQVATGTLTPTPQPEQRRAPLKRDELSQPSSRSSLPQKTSQESTQRPKASRPVPPLFSVERALYFFDQWLSELDGVELTYSRGEAVVSASAEQGSFTEGEVAKGAAQTQSLSLSLYRHPKGGWRWDTDGGVNFLSNSIKDFDRSNIVQPMRAGQQTVSVLCQPISIDGELIGGFQRCNLSNSYQLTLISASYGVWGGYQWLFDLGQEVKGHAEARLTWYPINLRWMRASISDYSVADEFSWSWIGVVRAGVLSRILITEQVGLGLSFDLEWTPSVVFTEPLEFRGAQICDEQSCQRERVFVRDISILSPSLGVHFIWTWSK